MGWGLARQLLKLSFPLSSKQFRASELTQWVTYNSCMSGIRGVGNVFVQSWIIGVWGMSGAEACYAKWMQEAKD